MAIALEALLIFSTLCALFVLIVLIAEGNSLFLCELVGIRVAEITRFTIAIGVLTLLLTELLLICVSTATACIKYKSKMSEADIASLTRKMTLLPILMTVSVIIPTSVGKCIHLTFRYLAFEQKKTVFVIGLTVFRQFLLEVFAGPFLAVLLLYFNTPLQTAFWKQMMCRKDRVHPESV